MNIQGWFPSGLIWSSFSPRDSQKSSSTSSKTSIFSTQPSLWVDPHIRTWLLEKPVLTRQTFVGKMMSLLYNMLYRLIIAFFPRSKRLLISWLQSPSAVIFEHKEIKSVTISTIDPYICYEMMGLDAMILVFWMLSFKPAFSLSSFTFMKRVLSSSSLPALRVVSSAYLRLFIFLLAILIPACASSWHFAWWTLHISELSRVKIYSLDIRLSQFGTTLLFHIWF